MKALSRFVGIWSLIFVLSGCGGGGEDVTNRPRIRVHWPPLGRSIQASAYANSLRITLPNAAATPATSGSHSSSDVVIEANRISDAESDVVYSVPAEIKPGKTLIVIETFSQANQAGRQLQSASESVYPDSSGFFPDIALADGRDSVVSVALNVDVPPGPPGFPTDIPTVYVGTSPSIYLNTRLAVFSGQDASGDGKFQVSFSENLEGDVIESSPFRMAGKYYYEVKTVHPGIVTLKASVDGIDSEPVRFRVIPRP